MDTGDQQQIQKHPPKTHFTSLARGGLVWSTVVCMCSTISSADSVIRYASQKLAMLQLAESPPQQCSRRPKHFVHSTVQLVAYTCTTPNDSFCHFLTRNISSAAMTACSGKYSTCQFPRIQCPCQTLCSSMSQRLQDICFES